MTQTLLHTEKLSIGYEKKTGDDVIASGIDLSLKEASLISIVGANGIGKSTLLRTLTGIQKPLAGTISLAGHPLESYNPSELAKNLSLVLTEKLPPSSLTVFELISLGRQPYTNWIGKLTDDDLSKIKLAMQMTETEHLVHKKHYEISDGQLQKVMIARALAQDTPLVVLDEPTTHLDLRHKVSLFRLLKKLASETGKCILFSTHDIEMAIGLSDEMVLMFPGKTRQGKPAEFIAENAFDDLFPEDGIRFDKEKVKFVFNNL